MENVHILTQRISGRGEFLPFSAEQYNSNTPTALHELAAKLQTSLVLEDILGTFANFAKQHLKSQNLFIISALERVLINLEIRLQ